MDTECAAEGVGSKAWRGNDFEDKVIDVGEAERVSDCSQIARKTAERIMSCELLIESLRCWGRPFEDYDLSGNTQIISTFKIKRTASVANIRILKLSF